MFVCGLNEVGNRDCVEEKTSGTLGGRSLHTAGPVPGSGPAATLELGPGRGVAAAVPFAPPAAIGNGVVDPRRLGLSSQSSAPLRHLPASLGPQFGSQSVVYFSTRTPRVNTHPSLYIKYSSPLTLTFNHMLTTLYTLP